MFGRESNHAPILFGAGLIIVALLLVFVSVLLFRAKRARKVADAQVSSQAAPITPTPATITSSNQTPPPAPARETPQATPVSIEKKPDLDLAKRPKKYGQILINAASTFCEEDNAYYLALPALPVVDMLYGIGYEVLGFSKSSWKAHISDSRIYVQVTNAKDFRWRPINDGEEMVPDEVVRDTFSFSAPLEKSGEDWKVGTPGFDNCIGSNDNSDDTCRITRLSCRELHKLLSVYPSMANIVVPDVQTGLVVKLPLSHDTRF